jgi:hypothetical protein
LGPAHDINIFCNRRRGFLGCSQENFIDVLPGFAGILLYRPILYQQSNDNAEADKERRSMDMNSAPFAPIHPDLIHHLDSGNLFLGIHSCKIPLNENIQRVKKTGYNIW